MSEPDEYIEAYFTHELNESEKRQFEERCVQDEAFARQVAFYVTTREAIRQRLLEQKVQLWSGSNDTIEEDHREKIRTVGVEKRMMPKWLPYATAACFLFAIALYFLYRSETPRS